MFPQTVKNRLVYCVKNKLTLLDLSTGNKLWQAEEADRAGFFFAPDETSLYSIDDEDICGYDLK